MKSHYYWKYQDYILYKNCNYDIHVAAIKKPDCFYDSFPATSMMRRVGH
jgi:hypothetical protein